MKDCYSKEFRCGESQWPGRAGLSKAGYCLVLMICLLASASHVMGQGRTVSGRIMDENSQTLPGVNVLVKGTSEGTTSDADGKYTLTVNDGSAILIFSFIGYTTREISVDGKTAIDVTMQPDITSLEEVVVVGYGEQKKVTVTGAIATVDSKVFQDRGIVSNPLSTLQGQVPGVIVTRNSAAPGQEDWQFQIRGATSINGTAPLVIVDDIPLPNINALNSINPNDIDNISFLKDASAAIYGARAAGGVVLITTKEAMTGKPRITYNGSLSQKRMGLRPGMLRADQYGQYLLEAISNASTGGVPDENWIWTKYARAWMNRPASGYIDKTVPGYVDDIGFTDTKDYTFFDTNPIDLLWNDKTVSNSHDLSFSARTDVMGYRLSLGYMHDGSLLKWGKNSNDRYNLRLNYDYKFSDRLKMKTNISLEKNDVVFPSRQAEINYGSQPGFPVSTINGKPYAWGTQNGRNWLLELGGENVNRNNRIFTSTRLEYKVLNDLKLVGVAGYSWWATDNSIQNKYIPEIYNYTETYQYPGNPRQDQSWYERGLAKDTYFNTNAYLEYKKKFMEAHEIEAMVGGNFEKEAFNYYWTRTGYQASNEVPSLGLGLGDNTTKSNGETRWQWGLASAFGRLKYAYKAKYLFEATGRYDGSSRFADGKRWIFYSGVSGGWRISEEDFMQNVAFVNELKIRGSYGTAGNSATMNSIVGYNDYIQKVNITGGGPVLGPYASRTVVAGPSGTLPAANQTWEKNQTKNIAVDFSLLNNRLFGTFEHYWKENKNMFFVQEYSAVLGATAPADNVGSMKIWGWEMSLGWRDQIGEVHYYINGSLTDNSNELTGVPGANVITSGMQNIQGYPMNAYFGVVYDGRIQTDEEVASYALMAPGSNISNMPSATQIIKGINRYKDLNGDGKLTNAGANQYTLGNAMADGDVVFLGRSDPRYAFAINMGADFKGIDFSAVFQGVGQRNIYRRSDWSTPFGTIWQGHADWWVGKTWTPENPNAELPILTTATNKGFGGYGVYNYQISDWSLQDGAYVRLKNIVIGYTLPQEISRKAKIERLRVYFSGNDLWEWSKIKDAWDPEQTANIGTGGAYRGYERYPFYRLMTFGLNVTF